VSAGHISDASEIRREVTWCTAVERAVSQDGDFETDSFRYSQPVKADQRIGDTVVPTNPVDESCCSTLSRLKSLDDDDIICHHYKCG